MATCRTLIADALSALQVLAPGDEPGADELEAGLRVLGDLLIGLHEARGPMHQVDAAADRVAGENERVRIAAGFTVTVTLPNSVRITQRGRLSGPGSIAPADGVVWRAPRDGARVEIVGAAASLFFYRADLNQWTPALGLGLDDPMPLNGGYAGDLAAVLAERLAPRLSIAEPSPGLMRRAALGFAALMLRTGVDHDPAPAEFF